MSSFRPGATEGEEALDKGAAATAPHMDLTDGVPEAVPRAAPIDEKKLARDGGKSSLFNSKGAIGKQFTKDGMLGGAAQKIGGPLRDDRSIGKQFTDKGAIGRSVQDMLGGGKKRGG